MRPTLTRCTQAMACAAAVLSLAACGGDADGEKTSATSPESSAASSEPTYDDDYAYAEAKKAEEKYRAHDLNQPLAEDTEWATPSYIKAYNDQLAALKEQGVTQKGTVKVDSMHEETSNPDAVGGWNLTMYQCSTSTVRLYKGGKDVTARPADPTKPAPKGPQRSVHLLSYATPDDGKTWQLDKAQLLLGEDARDSPCQSN